VSNIAHISRVLALLSDGVAAWAHARKIVETPFPFPHAHLVAISLMVFAFTAPLVMVTWSNSVWVAVLMDALAVTVYIALNEVRARP
jgi:predicted membrane chloride channel (bestrophin family)